MLMTMRVVIPADDPPLVGRSRELDRLRDACDVILYDDRPASEAEKLRRLLDADILLNSRGHVSFSRPLLEQLPRLKMIAVCGIGFDSIDIDAAAERGVVVSNVPGRTARVVAEHAIALMFSVARRTAEMTRLLRSGVWSGDLGVALYEKTIGVVGAGAIGQQVMHLASALGMRVLYWTFHPDQNRSLPDSAEFADLPELLEKSDVVSLHVRLSSQSQHLINADSFQRMKPGAILINTARGPVVDTGALVHAVQGGHLSGAGVDVFDQEPISADHPLCDCTNVVLTPHSADQTPEGIDLLTAGCVDNILAFLAGNPSNVVTPSR